MVVKVIVIIIGGASVVGAGFLALAAGSLLTFSLSGDGIKNTLNTVTRRTLCWPSMELYYELAEIGRQMKMNGVAQTQENTEAAIKKYKLTFVDAGTEVRVHESHGVYNPQLQQIFYRVSYVDGSNRACFVLGNYLEMNLVQWIKWKSE